MGTEYIALEQEVTTSIQNAIVISLILDKKEKTRNVGIKTGKHHKHFNIRPSFIEKECCRQLCSSNNDFWI